ncbi:PREDICTED: HVA22-like protein d [Camelina sativa]|uniref:HVA22-like protein n=1 Tax=Camelina sativa TaxID=90675 RepID=A0ABM0UC22_CAMSA|nr:PREDICTED: HVA22-like protein d [Camelina sativa]
MDKFWTFLTALHSGAGPIVMLLYPLYASVIAMESATKLDDEQWLAYWIIYSFLSLIELILQSLIDWIPIWYTVKLVFVAWLVLPQFQGAAFIYNRVVREQFKKHGVFRSSHHSSKASKPNILQSIFPHREGHEAHSH